MTIATTREQILQNTFDFFLDFFNDRSKKYQKQKFSDFKINPFTIQATAKGLSGSIDADSISKAIVYPFAFGTSIATSFGTNLQKFIVTTMGDQIAQPSVISGMDIEYVEQIDNRRKYCQLKSGPTTINKDDIKTIEDHFMGLRNLARTNHLAITTNDPVVGVLYGSHRDLSTMYKTIQNDGYNVLAGEEFWLHLTGYEDLYRDLVNQAQLAANNSAMQESIDKLLSTVKEGIEQNEDFFGI